MSNGYGNVHVTRAADMAAYDDAPPPLRWLIRNAVSPFSAVHMVRQYWQLRQKKNVPHPVAIDIVTKHVERCDREHTVTAYGPTHPEAQAPIMCEAIA